MKQKILLIFFLFTAFIFSQENKSSIYFLESFFNDIEKLNLSKAEKQLDNITDKNLQKQLLIYFDLKKNNGYKKSNFVNYIDNIELENRKINIHYLLDLLILNEQTILYNNNRIDSFDLAHKGFKISEKINSKFFQTLFILNILRIYKLGIVNNDSNVNFYLEKLIELNSDNKLYLFKYYYYKIYLTEIGILKNDSSKIQIEKRKISSIALNKLKKTYNNIEEKSNIGILFYHTVALCNISNKKLNLVIDFLNREQELLKNEQSLFFYKLKYNNLKEIARVYSLQNKFDLAKKYLNKSKKYENKLTPLRNSFVYNLYVSEIFNGLNQKDSAFITMKTAFHNSLSLNFKKQNNLISSLEVKNKTAEKEKRILIEQQKKEENRNLFYGTLSFLILGGSIGLLALNNSKKKRLLAQQQQELEKQKNLTLLKEQEINIINAMINGQEKERIRIAEDLHDNIGSVLATLKLHFENLKLNREKKHFNQEELYNKTEKLIDETYLKIRNIAHAKNAGVIANKGLLVAVKLMAKKISDANKITIHVLDFGLNKRLENKLEITVFRIVQELVTNIIKHAEASEVTINIALYDQNLNIIIEDNGKGFIYDKTALKEGIGLSSIGTRVRHLNGSFTIDSTISKGTSIIINIPIT